MEIDPNWFYSSIAQCSAAIVGIMGAFLIGKTLHQRQLQNDLYFQIEEMKKEIKFFETEEQNKHSEESQRTSERISEGGGWRFSCYSFSNQDKILHLKASIREKENQITTIKKSKLLFNTILFMFGFGLVGVFFPLAMLLTNYQNMINSRFGVYLATLIVFMLMFVFLLLDILDFNLFLKIKEKINKWRNKK